MESKVCNFGSFGKSTNLRVKPEQQDSQMVPGGHFRSLGKSPDSSGRAEKGQWLQHVRAPSHQQRNIISLSFHHPIHGKDFFT